MDIWQDLRDRYLALALEGAAREASELVKGSLDSFSYQEILLEVVGRAQEEVGNLWATTKLTVADEHLATGVAQLVAAELRSAIEVRQAPKQVTILASCVPGDLHSFPLRLACDLFEAQGHQVTYLGASLPLRNLEEMAQRLQPQVIALSCSVPIHLAAAKAAIQQLRDGPWKIVVGGRGFSGCGGQEGIDLVARSAPEGCIALDELIPA